MNAQRPLWMKVLVVLAIVILVGFILVQVTKALSSSSIDGDDAGTNSGTTSSMYHNLP